MKIQPLQRFNFGATIRLLVLVETCTIPSQLKMGCMRCDRSRFMLVQVE